MDAERATRVLLRLPVRYRVVGATDWREGKTENISRSGVLFLADDLIAVDSEVELSFTLPEDGTWLIVTSVIADPDYLTQEFVLSSQFKKETDLSKWNPRPCDIPAPVVPARAPA